jgi:hypothetical protein
MDKSCRRTFWYSENGEVPSTLATSHSILIHSHYYHAIFSMRWAPLVALSPFSPATHALSNARPPSSLDVPYPLYLAWPSRTDSSRSVTCPYRSTHRGSCTSTTTTCYQTSKSSRSPQGLVAPPSPHHISLADFHASRLVPPQAIAAFALCSFPAPLL